MTKSEETRCWVGFDLGGTKMLSAVFDQDSQQISSRRRRTKGHFGMDAGLKRIAETIRQALDDAEVDAEQIGGIGVGVPGPVDLERGVILEAVNLGWRDVPLRQYLSDTFACPTVVINDVDAGVYAENRFGAARSGRCVLGVFPGTGIGGGCVYEDQIIRGKTNSAMEIGHIVVVPDGPKCGCGLHGCLEAVASRLALAAMAAQAAYRGDAPHLMAMAGTDLANIRSSVLAKAIAEGDHVIRDMVEQACQHLGRVIAGVVNLLVPDIIVLGGGLMEAMPHLMINATEQAIRRYVMPALTDSFHVVAAELGDSATVMGAAAWAAKLFSHPATH